jgi:hypothetical protein
MTPYAPAAVLEREASQDTPTRRAVVEALPVDPVRAVRAMMARVAALQSVYERETGALEAAQVETFMQLQADKLAAAAAYQAGMEALLARKAEVEGVLDPALRGQIAAMQATFAAVTRRNMEALERMQRSVTRLADKICAAARADVAGRGPVGYGPGGAAGGLKTVSTGHGEVV